MRIEDLKIGDELVCIDLKSMAKKWENASDLWRKAKIDALKVSSINKELTVVYFQDNKFYLEEHEFQYFKKKEQSQYTFDDLIDVTTQAVKDKVINGANIRLHEIGFMHNKTHYKLMLAFDCKEQIDLIKSLYKETFVIEDYEDIKRIKNNANITLSNGNRIEQAVLENQGDYVVFNDSADNFYTFGFIVLKGATVEQEQGSDD